MVQAPVKPAVDEWIEIRFPAETPLSDELFGQLAAANDCLRFERSAEGALVIVSFPGTDGVDAETVIISQLWGWAGDAGGRALSSGALYRMPDGAVLLPDASWLTQAQWDGLSADEHRSFIRSAPLFVVEVRSPSQTLAHQQRKMERWIGYGVKLGWLVDQRAGRLWVYRPDAEPEELERPAEISGDPELAGFTVDLSEVWR